MVAQAAEVCTTSECNLHRLKTFFGAGTALLYILVVSVTHYNALNRVHKPADGFPSGSEGTVSLC